MVGRPLASLNDFLACFWLFGRLCWSPSRGMSLERRNLAAAKPIRDLTLRGPLISLVGAVVMMAGVEGKGGKCSACCFALKESCESEAFLNLRTEKRFCLLRSSWLCDVSGRLVVDSRGVCVVVVARSSNFMVCPSWLAETVEFLAGSSPFDEVCCCRASGSLARLPRRRRKGIARIAMHGRARESPWWPSWLG